MNPAVTTKWGRVCALLQLLLSATGLMAVSFGIPYVLAVSAGVPWPAPVSSPGDLIDRLAQPVSDPFVTQLLALIGWVCWAAFMVSVIREAAWAMRQLGTLLGEVTLLRTRLRTLPAHRAAAAFLVAALLLALAVIWRPTSARAAIATPAAPTGPAVVPATAPVTPQPPAPQQQPVEVPASVTRAYMVRPGDTLWDIARTHLGDPLRWPVIYQLNCDRVQSDGHRLRDPDLLHPGWTLHLPAHSARADVPLTGLAPATSTPHRNPVTPPHQHSTPALRASLPTQHRQQTSTPRPSQHSAVGTPRRHEQRRPVEIGVGTASAIGITTATGIATAVSFARAHARRRRQPDLAAAAPPPLADAVRAATTAAHLAAGQAQQEQAEADDEATLPRHPAPAEPTAPGTATCAIRDGQELTADVLAIPGGITLTGPGADPAARALAVAVLSAAERLRPGQPKVRLITPTATAQRLLPHVTDPLPAWIITRDCAQALSLIDQHLLHHARLADADGDIAANVAADEPPMDLLITDLDPQTVERLKATAHRAAPSRLAVILLHADEWPCQAHLTAEGTVTTATGPAAQLLDGARMFTLGPTPARELLDILYAAHGHTAPTTPTAPPPASAAVPIPPPSTPAPRPQDPSTLAKEQPQETVKTKRVHGDNVGEKEQPPAPVTVHILGRFRIRARGKEEEFGHGMRAETREFLSLLAAHPTGIRSEEITEALRMAADPEQAARELANLRRAVRRSLRQATGAHQAAFVVRAGDRHLLDANLIATDIAAFTTAIQQASTARHEEDRAVALKAAVAAYGGPLCEGADYPWADELREAVHRKAVDALVLLADHTAKSQPDPDQALALLDQAAEWDPYNEAVYQRIIRLQRSTGRDDAAHRTYALLKRRLADLDATVDPATTALVQRQRQPAASR
jgi:two-component SAPR family response regulator